jgi:hypothetical protein
MRTKLTLATLLVFLFASLGRAEEVKRSRVEKAVAATKAFLSLNLSFHSEASKPLRFNLHPRPLDEYPGCNPLIDSGCVSLCHPCNPPPPPPPDRGEDYQQR